MAGEALIVGAVAGVGALLVASKAGAASLPAPPRSKIPATGPDRWRGVVFAGSPHFSGRASQAPVGIIIHYTAGGPASGTVKWFQNPTAKVAAHFVVDRDGSVVQLVDLTDAAWHAGAVKLPNGSADGNAATIGIEIANRGLLSPSGKSPGQFIVADGSPYTGSAIKATHTIKGSADVDGYWEPYPEAQVNGVAWLVNELRRDFPIAFVVGHDETAVPPGRKTDPGPLWPWDSVR